MGITIEWLGGGRVCVAVAPAHVHRGDLQEYDYALSQALNMAAESIDLIADMRAIRTIPPLNELLVVSYVRHPKLGKNITVGLARNAVARLIITSGARMVGINYRDFNTLEEAKAYLAI